MRIKITLASLWILLFSAVTAPACTMFESQTLTNVTGADVALIGRVTGYDFQHQDGRKAQSARFTVKPILPLRGVWFSEQVIYWENSTFGAPAEWNGDQTVFIAANLIDPKLKKLRGGIFDHSGDEVSLELLQSPCAPAFVFKAFSVRSVLASFLVLINWAVAIIAMSLFLRFVRIRRRRYLQN